VPFMCSYSCWPYVFYFFFFFFLFFCLLLEEIFVDSRETGEGSDRRPSDGYEGHDE